MTRDALVVGINQYPFLKDSSTSKAKHLKTPAGDAEAIAELLEKYGDNQAWSVRRLPEVYTKGKPSVGEKGLVKQAEMSKAISELFHPNTRYMPEVALLFFAGHGLRREQDGQTEGFLATSDTHPSKGKWGISLNWLREQLISSPVQKQIVWLDCCHSGELLNFLTEAELRDWLFGGDRCLIAACRDDRSAYGIGKHGVLSEVLLQALNPKQHPQGQWISSGTVTDFVEQQLESHPLLKRQIPLSRNFGERIRLWRGEQQPINSPTQTRSFEFSNFPLKKISHWQECTEEPNALCKGSVDVKVQLGSGVSLEMVLIPGGTFQMGSPDSEVQRTSDEGMLHSVTVASFLTGKFPVTQVQWQAIAALPQVNIFLNPNSSRFKGSERPVECVSWYEAVEFCTRLSKETGHDYRLPSEAEWEYACRAGTTTPFHFGKTITSELANYDGNYIYGCGSQGRYYGQTTSVGSFQIANAFGLYDMHGNIWEWCADLWHDSYDGAPLDGTAWETGDRSLRVLRGGSWVDNPGSCRSACRNKLSPDFRYSSIGFRVVCSDLSFIGYSISLNS